MHGSEWQRRCLLGRSSQSISEGSSQSGGGGRVKVREITDLLGVSNSLILPPLRSSLREKGLTRAGAAKKQEGMSEGRSMGSLSSEGLRSDVRERLRLGSSAALGKTGRNPCLSASATFISAIQVSQDLMTCVALFYEAVAKIGYF